MGRHRLAALAALAALPLALGACTGDPEPRVADPTSPPPTSEPTATSTPTPSEPPTSEPPGRESARAFIRRWQQVANEMQVSGDSAKYRSLGQQCASCDNFASNVDRIYAGGGFIRTEGAVVLRIERWGSVNGWATYDLSVESGPTTLRESASAPEQTLEGGKELFRVSIARSGSDWRVRRATQVVM